MTADRKKIPPYRCFFTWDIHYACNYRCSYCFFHDTWEEEKKKNRYPGIARWKEIWDGIFRRYGGGHIHISGGEPFCYPDILELVEHLTKNFTVEFDTNLSFDVQEFMRRIGPQRVKFATAFHPQFADFEEYLKKVTMLKKAGYDLGVNFVAFPEQLKEMPYYKRKLEEVHISFDVMPFRGKYRGKEYPQGFTEEERKFICEVDPRTAARQLREYAAAPGGNKDAAGPPAASANEGRPPQGQERPAHAQQNPHYGKTCRMGQMYAKIHANGNAYRCCLIKEQSLLGNIIDGTFAFYEEAKVCELDKCPCWVAMIMQEEDNWMFHWITPKVRPGIVK